MNALFNILSLRHLIVDHIMRDLFATAKGT